MNNKRCQTYYDHIPSMKLIPQSMTTDPGLIHSFLTIRGWRIPTTMMSDSCSWRQFDTQKKKKLLSGNQQLRHVKMIVVRNISHIRVRIRLARRWNTQTNVNIVPFNIHTRRNILAIKTSSINVLIQVKWSICDIQICFECYYVQAESVLHNYIHSNNTAQYIHWQITVSIKVHGAKQLG